MGNPFDTRSSPWRRAIISGVRCIFPVSESPLSADGGTSGLGTGDLDQLYGAPNRSRPRRPWVGVCMIASLDGSTVVNGRSGALGNPSDSAVFAALRRRADAIVVGAATARAERYGAPRRRGQRIGVVTSTGDVDRSSDLFTSGAGFLLMPDDGPSAPSGIDVVRAGRGRVDLPTALLRFDEIMEPPAFVQAEGGSRLNGALLDADCVDELNVSFAPALVGGAGPRLVTGAAETMQLFEPVHVLIDDDGYLFSRWVRRDPAPAPP